MADERKDRQTQDERIASVEQQYESFLGWAIGADVDEAIVIREITDHFQPKDVRNNLTIFEKYIPFIKKHFDKSSPFNLSLINKMINDRNSRWALISLYPVFDDNPELMELYSKRDRMIDKSLVNDGVNRNDRRRLMFTSDPKSEEGTVRSMETTREVERVIARNKKLYKDLSEKYEDIGNQQIVLCTLLDDAELCIRFINTGIEVGKRGRCQVLIRPNQSEASKGSSFSGIELNLTEKGLIYDQSLTSERNIGILFLAPPYGRAFDEKALIELVASEKSNREIQEELESGATGVLDILTK